MKADNSKSRITYYNILKLIPLLGYLGLKLSLLAIFLVNGVEHSGNSPLKLIIFLLINSIFVL
jgi:hypothetical protein